MSQVVRDGDRLVLTLGNVDPDQKPRRFDFQLLSPLLLGLMVPFVAASYFDPEGLRHLKGPLWLFLFFMLIVCTGIFVYTLHFPGEIKQVVFDRSSRSVEIIWTSLMSITSQVVPFTEISALRMRNDYDDDGYASPVAELVLRSNAAVVLPEGITEEHLLPIRAALGLG